MPTFAPLHITLRDLTLAFTEIAYHILFLKDRVIINIKKPLRKGFLIKLKSIYN